MRRDRGLGRAVEPVADGARRRLGGQRRDGGRVGQGGGVRIAGGLLRNGVHGGSGGSWPG